MEVNDEIISRLKFIAKINPGEKISVKGMYVQPDGILTTISRSLITHDSRENTMNFLNTAIKKGFDILSTYSESKSPFDRQMFMNVLTDLRAAKTGLANLRQTYDTDRMFCCKLDTLEQEIDAKLLQYNDVVTMLQ